MRERFLTRSKGRTAYCLPAQGKRSNPLRSHGRQGPFRRIADRRPFQAPAGGIAGKPSRCFPHFQVGRDRLALVAYAPDADAECNMTHRP